MKSKNVRRVNASLESCDRVIITGQSDTRRNGIHVVRKVVPSVKERDIERYLIDQVKRHGGLFRKLKWIGRKSAPDRFISFNDYGSFLVEVKRPGETWQKSQKREAKRLRAAGTEVALVCSVEDVNMLIDWCVRRYAHARFDLFDR